MVAEIPEEELDAVLRKPATVPEDELNAVLALPPQSSPPSAEPKEILQQAFQRAGQGLHQVNQDFSAPEPTSAMSAIIHGNEGPLSEQGGLLARIGARQDIGARNFLVNAPSNIVRAARPFTTDQMQEAADRWQKFADDLLPKAATNMPPPNGMLEQGADAVGDVSIAAPLIYAGAGAAGMAGAGPALSTVTGFAGQTAAQGGSPIEGAAYGALAAGASPFVPRTVLESTAQKLLESAAFFKAAQVGGADRQQAAIQAMLPMAVHMTNAAFGIVRADPVRASEIASNDAPSRAQFKNADLPETQSSHERAAFSEAVKQASAVETDLRLAQIAQQEAAPPEPPPPIPGAGQIGTPQAELGPGSPVSADQSLGTANRRRVQEALPNQAERRTSVESGLTEPDPMVKQVLQLAKDQGRIPTKAEIVAKLGGDREQAKELLQKAYGGDVVAQRAQQTPVTPDEAPGAPQDFQGGPAESATLPVQSGDATQPTASQLVPRNVADVAAGEGRGMVAPASLRQPKNAGRGTEVQLPVGENSRAGTQRQNDNGGVPAWVHSAVDAPLDEVIAEAKRQEPFQLPRKDQTPEDARRTARTNTYIVKSEAEHNGGYVLADVPVELFSISKSHIDEARQSRLSEIGGSNDPVFIIDHGITQDGRPVLLAENGNNRIQYAKDNGQPTVRAYVNKKALGEITKEVVPNGQEEGQGQGQNVPLQQVAQKTPKETAPPAQEPSAPAASAEPPISPTAPKLTTQERASFAKQMGWKANDPRLDDLIGKAQIEPPSAPGLLDKVASAGDAAGKRITEKLGGGTLRAGIDPTILSDLAIWGAGKIATGTRNVIDFAKAMQEHLGEKWDDFKEHLPQIWSDSQDAYRKFVRPDLANPAVTEQGRGMVDAVDIQRRAAGEPEPRPRDVAEQQGQQMAAADPEGVKARLFEAAKQGKTYESEADQAAARAVLRQEELKAVATKQTVEFNKIVDADRRAATEASRIMGARADQQLSPQERWQKVWGSDAMRPPERIQNRIDEAREAGRDGQADKLLEQWQRKYESLADLLRKLGYDPATLSKITDPRKQAEVGGIINSFKATPWDKTKEFFRNAIFGPLSLARKAGSDTAHVTGGLTYGKMVDAMVGEIGRRTGAMEGGAHFGELPVMMKALMPSLRKSFESAVRSFGTEIPQHKNEFEWGGKMDTPNVAIQGTKGRILRWPQRGLSAINDFYQTLGSQLGVQAHAYRIATNEGLSGDSKANRIANLVSDTKSEAWTHALADADRWTANQKGGFAAQKVKEAGTAVQRIPGMYYIVPVVKVPTNLYESGIRYTPLGLVSDFAQAAKTGEWSKVVGSVAKQGLAWGAVATVAGMVHDGQITGSSDDKHPMSIRVGDKWYSYANIEPFATSLGTTVDGVHAFEKGGTMAGLFGSAKSLVTQLKDKSFLRGLGDIIDAVSSKDDHKFLNWASRFASSWWPNVLRSAGKSIESEVPERRIFGDHPYEMAFQRAIQNTETHLIQDLPKRDVWGRPMNAPTSSIPGTDIPYRMISALVESRNVERNAPMPGDLAIAAWNRLHPDQAVNPPVAPSTTIEIGKKRLKLSPQQFDDYVRISGEHARALVSQMNIDTASPTLYQVKMIEKAIAAGRAYARHTMFPRGQ